MTGFFHYLYIAVARTDKKATLELTPLFRSHRKEGGWDSKVIDPFTYGDGDLCVYSRHCGLNCHRHIDREGNRPSNEKKLAEKAMNIAQMVARSELIIEALEGKRDEAEIQSFADGIRRVTNVRFIVVMDMRHIRKSHPDPNKIGKRFAGGDENKAMQGKTYTSIAEGTLGRSLRAFAPIRNDRGKQIGVVAVGILLNQVEEAVIQSTRIVYIGIGFGVLVGILGALVLARKIKNVLLAWNRIRSPICTKNGMPCWNPFEKGSWQ